VAHLEGALSLNRSIVPVRFTWVCAFVGSLLGLAPNVGFGHGSDPSLISVPYQGRQRRKSEEFDPGHTELERETRGNWGREPESDLICY